MVMPWSLNAKDEEARNKLEELSKRIETLEQDKEVLEKRLLVLSGFVQTLIEIAKDHQSILKDTNEQNTIYKSDADNINSNTQQAYR